MLVARHRDMQRGQRRIPTDSVDDRGQFECPLNLRGGPSVAGARQVLAFRLQIEVMLVLWIVSIQRRAPQDLGPRVPALPLREDLPQFPDSTSALTSGAVAIAKSVFSMSGPR